MLRYLIQKEIIQMRRNAFIPRLIFVFPIMIMCVMPWVLNLEVENIRIVAVDADGSEASRRLLQRIGASHYFRFQGTQPSYTKALEEVEHGRADIILSVPPHYERELVRGERPRLHIAANAVNGTVGTMGTAYLTQIIGEETATAGKASAAILDKAAGIAEAGTATPHFLYNPHLDYKVFMIPALMAILIVLLCGFLPALNVVGEKETGNIEQINVSPVSKWTFIAAKLIPYWAVGLVVLTVCFVLARVVYGIVPTGSVALLYLTSALLVVTFSGFGLAVSSHSDTMQQAMFVMWFFVVCMMLLSGLFTPVSSMPEWAQRLTLINPIRHYIDTMRTVFIRGGSFTAIAPQLAALTAFATAAALWAVKSYRKQE